MKKYFFLLVSVCCYLLFLVTFIYLIGFVQAIWVPKNIDTGIVKKIIPSLAINLALMTLFGVQHSIMARKSYKAWISKVLPVPIERSIYVFWASLILIILMYCWQPIPFVIWNVNGTLIGYVLQILGFFGWGLVLVSTFMINHFDLFGLRQAYIHMRNERYESLKFRTPIMYKIIRHPLYLGFMFAFWSTPIMTAGHLLFAMSMLLYILVGIHYEEKDLMEKNPEYAVYKKKVGKLFPRF
jgi:protein-S-isoprenylcysteine O-methyltransferase Ste14